MAKIKKHRKSVPSGDLVSRARPHQLKPQHTKPYRRRHIFLLVAALAYLALLMFQLGVIVGGSRQGLTNEPSTVTPSAQSTKTITSSFGVSLGYNPAVFKPSATAIDDKGAGSAVSTGDLAAGKPINYATLKPISTAVAANLASSQLTVQILPDTATLTNAQKAKPTAKPQEIAQELLPVSSSADFDVSVLSRAEETIGDGATVLRTTYQFVPKFDGAPSYAVTWHGVSDDHAVVIKLSGLVGSSAVPAEYGAVMDSVVLGSGEKVRGISFRPGESVSAATSTTLDSKYVADLVSPAVVKIYNIVCGDLTIANQSYGNVCDGGTGSGFILTQDGYIATNGHVVVLTAKDMFVSAVTSSAETFASFLRGTGYSDAEIASIMSDPQQVASVVAKIYDLDDSQIFLDQPQQITLVALGDTPLSITKDQSLQDLMNYSENDNIKKAKIIGTDYNSKDLWVAQSGDASGFSSSDVALLKVDIKDAPTVSIAPAAVSQSEKITVLGFPGDAENVLVDNSTLDVSVTSGTISAIKDAAGGNGKLYQSDADASHGNSGGPAVNDKGEVFGLLTYRISGDDQGNAAKSYMRDITDLADLAKEKSVTINSTSATQDAWRKGLELYSQNHFSAARKEFQKVNSSYKPHRLVEQYMDNAKKQIAAGHDVPLYSPILIGGAILAGVAVLAAALVLIVRHRARHQAYLQQHGAAPSNTPVSPANTADAPAVAATPALPGALAQPTGASPVPPAPAQPAGPLSTVPPALQPATPTVPLAAQPQVIAPAPVQPLAPQPTVIQPQTAPSTPVPAQPAPRIDQIVPPAPPQIS